MKLATLAVPTGTTLAVLVGDELIDVTQHWESGAGCSTAPSSVTEVVLGGSECLAQVRSTVDSCIHTARRMQPAECVFLPPHLPDSTVFCVGVNYLDHSAEAGPGFDTPSDPTYFAKDPRSFCGPYDSIVAPASLTTMLDWEVELAVVIGKAGRRIASSVALEHVVGYTIVNDVSARDVQMGRGQWFLGKNLAASSPIGPYLVTSDEVDDPQSLTVKCTVDGQLRQHAHTSDMVHSVANLIADLSRFVDLHTGDVICTGTPAGVGAAADPPAFLTRASRMVTEIDGLGLLDNTIDTEIGVRPKDDT